METAASQITREVDLALAILIGISGVLWLGIVGTMVYFVIRYRRSRARTILPLEKHTGLEITWTVVPTLLVLGMFYVGFRGFWVLAHPPADAMPVEVLGQQWFWSFTYPEQGVTATDLYVPVNTPVLLKIRSADSDVLHSFYLPAFRIKEDAVPGQETTLWFEAEEEGTYNIFCAEFCGKDHSKMLAKLYVVSRTAFDAWLKKQAEQRFRAVDVRAGLDPRSEDLKGVDARALYQRYCAACHGATGEGGGPYKARNFHSAEGWKRSPKETDIFTTISTGIEGTAMRPFRHLSAAERFALTHQVASFLENGQRPPVTEQDMAELRKRFPETDPASYRGASAVSPRMTVEEAMRRVVEEAADGPPAPDSGEGRGP